MPNPTISNMRTLRLWTLVKLNGSLENLTPPLVFRLTKYEFWFPGIPQISFNSCSVHLIPSNCHNPPKILSFRTQPPSLSPPLHRDRLTGDFPDQVRRHLLRVVRHFGRCGRRYRGWNSSTCFELFAAHLEIGKCDC